MLDAARRKVAVRILLNEPVASWPEGVFWLPACRRRSPDSGRGAVGLVALVMGAGVALLPVFIGLALVVYAPRGLLRRGRRSTAAPTSRS